VRDVPREGCELPVPTKPYSYGLGSGSGSRYCKGGTSYSDMFCAGALRKRVRRLRHTIQNSTTSAMRMKNPPITPPSIGASMLWVSFLESVSSLGPLLCALGLGTMMIVGS